jgi:hypothetical protein
MGGLQVRTKPHISWGVDLDGDPAWCCRDEWLRAYGATPAEAYEVWKTTPNFPELIESVGKIMGDWEVVPLH